jgi:hypothetical protein
MAECSLLDDSVINKRSEEEEVDMCGWTAAPVRKRPAVTTEFPPAKHKQTCNIELQNRFESLSSTNDEASGKTPPIFIQNVGLKNYSTFVNDLQSTVGAVFECQSTSKDGLTIYPNSPDDYRNLVKALILKEYKFHSYQLPQEKAYRVVLRYLHPSTAVEDIAAALESLSFRVRRVVNVLQTGTKIPLPLHFVDLEPDKDNSRIFKISSLLYTRIKVEEPRKKEEILQCKRCLQFGHSRSYCNHTPRCARCGGLHDVNTCQRGANDKRVCVLCQGDHSSLYKGCQVYKELRSKKLVRSVQPPIKTGSHASRPSSTRVFGSPTPTSTAQATTSTQPDTLVSPVAARARISSRDPRTLAKTYAQAANSSHQSSPTPHTPSYPSHSSFIFPSSHDSSSSNQAPIINQDNLLNVFQSFFNRLQDMLSPLLSTLNLLVSKLLS